VDETIRAYMSDPTSDYEYAVEHLLALDHSFGQGTPGDSPQVHVLYFISSYTLARLDRDNTDEESAATQELDEADVDAIREHLGAHPRFDDMEARFLARMYRG
jgi:hypothetical protein